MIIDGAGHYDMYDDPDYLAQAVERLASFCTKHLVSTAS